MTSTEQQFVDEKDFTAEETKLMKEARAVVAEFTSDAKTATVSAKMVTYTDEVALQCAYLLKAKNGAGAMVRNLISAFKKGSMNKVQADKDLKGASTHLAVRIAMQQDGKYGRSLRFAMMLLVFPP